MVKELVIDILEQYPYARLEVRVDEFYPIYVFTFRTDKITVRILAKPKPHYNYHVPGASYSFVQMVYNGDWIPESISVERRN